MTRKPDGYAMTKTPEELAEEYLTSDESCDAANEYDRNLPKTFMGQQKTFRAHLDGQRIGYLAGYAAGVEVALDRTRSQTEREKIAFNNGYEAGVARWVSVTERLPEVGKPIVVYRKINGTMSICFWSSEKIWMFNYGPDQASGITHWLDNVPALPGEGQK